MEKQSTEAVLNTLREWLKGGAIIKATDITDPILQQNNDGTWIGGLTVEFLSPPVLNISEITFIQR